MYDALEKVQLVVLRIKVISKIHKWRYFVMGGIVAEDFFFNFFYGTVCTVTVHMNNSMMAQVLRVRT